MFDRGDGYYEAERGWFNASLIYEDEEIARTDGDLVIAYDESHKSAVEEWAEEYGYPIEWRLK